VKVTRVSCGNCGRSIDQPPDLDPSEREPYPDCGSMARVFEAHGSALVGTTATLALEKVHEEIVRHWGWLLASIGITVGGSFLGFFLVGFLGVVVGLALGLVSYLTGRRGETVVREIERR
jgi:hypothetical protein